MVKFLFGQCESCKYEANFTCPIESTYSAVAVYSILEGTYFIVNIMMNKELNKFLKLNN